MCEYCHTPTKTRKPKQSRKNETEDERKERRRLEKQEERSKKPFSDRKSDQKKGTGKLGPHRHDDPEKEQKEIDKEYNRLKMADGARLQRIIANAEGNYGNFK